MIQIRKDEKDKDVGQTGFWECPSCKARFHGGGKALHSIECKEIGYVNCTFLISNETEKGWIPSGFTVEEIAKALAA